MRGPLLPVEQRFKHPIGPQIHGILWNEWDPIGVKHMGVCSDDEYDGYVWPLISKIMEPATVEQIADYLDWAANEHMQCPQPRDRHLQLARTLSALKPRTDET